MIRKREQWFEHMADAHLALWWLPAGHTPTIDEAKHRLARLRELGDTPEAFGFRKISPAPA